MQTKEIYGPNLGHLDPILAQNEVFGHLLDFGSFDLSDFEFYDNWQRYLGTVGGRSSDKGNIWPKFGSFRPNSGQK